MSTPASSDILLQLEHKLPELSKSQKKVVEFVLSNPVKGAVATVQELASASGVSTATVVRTVLRLGYDSYSNFQHELHAFLMFYAVPIRRIESLSQVNAEAGCYDIDTILQQQIDNLLTTRSNLSDQQVSLAVNMLLNSSHIYVIAERNCRVTAYYLYHNLNRITDRVDLLSYYDYNLPEHLHRIGGGDVVISICMPRYAARIVNATRICKERGAKIISITDATNSPLSEFSDCTFTVQQRSFGLHNSQLASLFIAEILITQLCWLDVERAKNNLEETEAIFQSLRTKPAHALVAR